ncbi:MAG: HAD family hydrolase [Candidatus ainarchaeum sp.]|nr:HAD family hydrolase [Candidatus ainarchaeum sp.]
MARIKTVIFDWDGTLVDTARLSYGIYRHLFKIYGIPDVPWKKFREEFTADYHEYYAKKGIPRSEFENADRVWLRMYNDAEKEIRLVPGAKKLLFALHRKGIRMGIVSNGSGVRIRKEIRERGISKMFKIVVTADEIPDFKPSPKGIVYALGAMRAKPSEAMYVGDMVEDVIAGKRAGVATMGVATGKHPPKKIAEAGPDFLCQDVNSVMQVLL